MQAATLAAIAGFVDGHGLIQFQTFMSFMSGNTTQSGVDVGLGQVGLALPALTAIASFVLGVFVGSLLEGAGGLRRRYLSVVVLLGIATGLGVLGGKNAIPSIAMLGFGMGMMNTVVSHAGGQHVNIGFVSGTLNSLATHLAQAARRAPLTGSLGAWDRHITRAALLALVWLAFFCGAAADALLESRLGPWVLLPPMLLLLGLTVFAIAADEPPRQ